MSAWKWLRLLAPEAANRLLGGRAPVEGPTFTSPFTSRQHTCPYCRSRFTPLVYAPGCRTLAQHWHPETIDDYDAVPSGIFHYHLPLSAARCRYGPWVVVGEGGWVAVGQCSECTHLGGNDYVAAAWHTTHVLALCWGCDLCLEEGDLVQILTGDLAQTLYPICASCLEKAVSGADGPYGRVWGEDVVLWGQFVIVDGCPLFTRSLGAIEVSGEVM